MRVSAPNSLETEAVPVPVGDWPRVCVGERLGEEVIEGSRGLSCGESAAALGSGQGVKGV